MLIYLFIATFLIVVHLRLYEYAFDDAFIHFRVARNLFETGYPYYNANDLLKVSTSSGWIIFLTIFFGIARLINIENHFPLSINIINAFILFCDLYIYTRIVEILLKNRLSFSQKFLFQIILVALLLPSSIGLMETPLALLMAGLGIHLLLLSNPSGFALLGLAAYIRLELLILIMLAGLLVLVQKQHKLHEVIGYILLGTIPLVAFDLIFFQTVVPHSIIAKSVVYSLPALDTLLRMLMQPLPVFLNSSNQVGIIARSITILATLIITSWVAFREKKNLNGFWSLLFYLLSLGIMSIYVYGHALIFNWYTPLYMVPLLLACFLYSITAQHPRNIILKIPLVALFFFSTTFLFRTFYAGVYNPGAFILFESGVRLKTYLEVGRILNDEYPGASLLTSEIGGLGYSFRGEILDAAGLASSDALPYYAGKNYLQEANIDIGAIPPGYVKATLPDIIVSYDVFAQALLNDAIINQYNIIVIPAYLPEDAIYSTSETIGDSKYLRVYIHKKLPITEGFGGLED